MTDKNVPVTAGQSGSDSEVTSAFRLGIAASVDIDVVLDRHGAKNSAQQFVRYALSIGALELVPEGRQLKSGRISPYFFNSGLFCTATKLQQLSEAYVGAIDANLSEEELPEVVFGPAYKGVPLAVAVADMLCLSYDGDYDPGYAFNRKEVKNHGEGGIIVGSQLADKRVVIVDDVMTTGDSSGEAVEIVCAERGIPIACVIAFDRQERGSDEDLSATQLFTKKYGIPVFAAATLSDLIMVLEEGPDFPGASATLPKILAYKDQYGV